MTSVARSTTDGGYRKAKRLGGLEVHDHLELGRELHREIARLFSPRRMRST
jgi:hypothetical protein